MKLMLSAQELERMQSDIEDALLPDMCAIQAVTRVSDGQGGWTETWATVDSAPCRLDKAGGVKGMNADAVKSFSSWVISLPINTTLTVYHRILVNDVSYSVTSISEDGSWLAVKRATLEQIG